jgi:hypothetical protein
MRLAVSQRWPKLAMPAALRPDRVGVAMEVNSSGTLIAHCKYPGSWKRPGIREWLIEQTSRAIVLLDCGPDSAWLLKPDGSTDPFSSSASIRSRITAFIGHRRRERA